MRPRFVVWLIAAALSGCATVPRPLARGPFADITPRMAQASDWVGQRVRWGGNVVVATPMAKQTCFEVVDRPLDAAARPQATDRSAGRFIACADGFYDPAVYAPGREVTVIGTLQAPVMRKIGGYEYRFPQVRAEQVYLWPKWEPAPDVWPPYYDPWWYRPWGPWGPWGPYR